MAEVLSTTYKHHGCVQIIKKEDNLKKQHRRNKTWMIKLSL